MQMYLERNPEMLAPVKYAKGVPDAIKKFNKASDELDSMALLTIGQPIGGFFNWHLEKNDIRNASKVKSAKGLNMHLFGRIVAALIGQIF